MPINVKPEFVDILSEIDDAVVREAACQIELCADCANTGMSNCMHPNHKDYIRVIKLVVSMLRGEDY